MENIQNPEIHVKSSAAKIIWLNIGIVVAINILMRFIVGTNDGEGGLGLMFILMAINAGYSALLILITIGTAIARNRNWKYFLISALLVGIIGFGACLGVVQI